MVEWKKLGEVCDFQNGFAFKSSLFQDIGLPIVRITNIADNVVNLDDCKYFKLDDYKNIELDSFIIRKNDVLVAMSGATTGKIGIYNNENISYLNQRVGKFIPHVNILSNKFLYHFLLSQYQAIYIMAGGGAQPNLSSNKLLNDFLIPIPSKPEQERIVKILDTFTDSIANLKAQIDARRKQYEYYRDQLLDLEGKEGVEMKTIKEICLNICSGGTPNTSKKEYYNGNIPWLRTQEVDWKEIYDTEIKITEEAINNSSAKLIPKDCVIVAMYGATAAKVAINKIPLATNQACCNLEIDTSQSLVEFVYQWLCKEYKKIKAMGEGSQNNINGKKVKDYPIPIPSKAEQSRIVGILDQFEAIIVNLEAQLKAREKQYEYYRNKLLTFD